MPEKTPEERRQDDDSALTGAIINRQNAQVAFYRRLGITAVILGGLLSVVSIVALVVSLQAKGDLAAARSDTSNSLTIVESVVCGQTPRPAGCPKNFPAAQATPQTAQVNQFVSQLVNQLVARLEQVYPPPKAP